MTFSPRIYITSVALIGTASLAVLTLNHDNRNPEDGIRSVSARHRGDTPAYVPSDNNRFPRDLTSSTAAAGEAPRTKRGIRPQPSRLSARNDGTSITRNIPPTRKKPWRPAPQVISAVPASFVDITPMIPLPTGAGEFLEQLAQDFKAKMEGSGLSPADPAYKALWESEAFLNDIRFQTTYGNALWLQHHNQSQEAGVH